MDSSKSENNNLGAKIKKYRKRAGMSQMDLELAINAAHGSISRMESGKVNPTKETLGKISEVLQISSFEIADLLGLNISNQHQLVKAINKLSNCLSLDKTLQTSVDIMFDLFPNYNGGVIFLAYGNKLYSKTVSSMPKLTKALKYVPKPVPELNVKIHKGSENYVVKSIIENQILESNSVYDFIRGAVNKISAIAIGKILGFRVGVSIPLIYEDEIIGATLYTKRNEKSFMESEIEILKLLNEQLAITIMNARKIQELQLKLNKFENEG